jgi:hypothetical protein
VPKKTIALRDGVTVARRSGGVISRKRILSESGKSDGSTRTTIARKRLTYEKLRDRGGEENRLSRRQQKLHDCLEKRGFHHPGDGSIRRVPFARVRHRANERSVSHRI